jgi:hypothetical protein
LHFSLQVFKYEKGQWTMLKRMVVGIQRIPLDSNFANAILIDSLSIIIFFVTSKNLLLIFLFIFQSGDKT